MTANETAKPAGPRLYAAVGIKREMFPLHRLNRHGDEYEIHALVEDGTLRAIFNCQASNTYMAVSDCASKWFNERLSLDWLHWEVHPHIHIVRTPRPIIEALLEVARANGDWSLIYR